MVDGCGGQGLIPRLFLAAPDRLPANRVADCLRAACAAGDVASLLVPESLAKELTPVAQALGVAVLVSGDPRAAPRNAADGVQVEATAEAVAEARQSVGKNLVVGAYAGASRHSAMEAAEAGADYVALDQNGPAVGGEPIVKWWAEFFEIPCVAFAPAEAADLDILLPQKPDFIRPADAMWESSGAATQVVAALTLRLGRT